MDQDNGTKDSQLKRKNNELGSNRRSRTRRRGDSLSESQQSTPRKTGIEEPLSPSLMNSGPQHLYTDSAVTILLGSESQQIPQSKFLRHVWGDGLDSTCMVCQKDFTDGNDPPIRTLAFEVTQTLESSSPDITQAPISQHPIRVFNRHFDCIKEAKINYVPISHAWHEPVSMSQQSRTESIDAARLVYQMPVKTLIGLKNKFGSVEIWHDYLSVPQWHESTQQQLLLAIPTIYAFPERMIIHLDDVKIQDLERVKRRTGYHAFLDGISGVMKSRWFNRVWVTLEYIQGSEVWILSKDLEVFDLTAAKLCERAETNIAKYSENPGQDRFSDDALARGHQWRRTMSWIDMETWKSKNAKYRTFGAAVYILGQKDCRDAHDYYFAMRGLLGLGHNRNQVASIVSGDRFSSYLDIAWEALENGDYTPLLLTPIKREKRDGRAPWLLGHSRLTENLWDLGMCHQKANSQTIIRDGRIRPELEYVGTIVDFEYYNFNASSADTVFLHVVEKIISCSGVLSKPFCDAIERVFVDSGKKVLYTHWDISNKADTADHLTPERDYLEIRELLRYFLFPTRTRGRMLEVSKNLVEMLGLDQLQQQTNISRLDEAAREAEWYSHPSRGYQNMEGLARIRCRYCGTHSLFRLSVWDAQGIKSSHVFLIPGLLYDLTIPNGVGLVVHDKTIIGKTTYGTPTCECREIRMVDLGE
ncbi:hypothetical protein BDZ45DRAFT_409230 [Acephala macrosclerotiorum]|nr:hypothetical protein BDZ45DRAFT_409230 [Acephala macrosclerotiorum]